MARIFITGSADGLGYAAADTLLADGHAVIVHVRNEARRTAVAPLVARGAAVVVGDLADRAQVEALAAQVNALGVMDSVIHNAGVYRGASLLPVNVVAPYLLTALITTPLRLIYLSSDMHRGGRAVLDGMDWTGRRTTGSYSDSKLFVTALAFAVAARWPAVRCHAVDPGWVPTRMGGAGAPDSLHDGQATQVWLATSDDAAACSTGGYWRHLHRTAAHRMADSVAFQGCLLETLAQATGVPLL